MDVVLHIGVHRTGTTTVQRVMGASRETLVAGRIAYWGPKRLRGGLFQGLSDDPSQMLPWQARRRKRMAGRIKLAMETHRQEGMRTLLVSEENIAGMLRPNLTRQSLYPDADTRLARLAEAFGKRCIRVAIGIRCYDRYWSSALAFALARGGPPPTSQMCSALVAQPRRWRDLVHAAAQAFPQAEIVVWTHEALAARPEQQVAALLGGPAPRLKAIRDWHNASPTPAALREVMMDRGEDPGVISEMSGKFMPFTALQRSALRAHYAEDLGWLRGGADGLARYIDDPATDWGATGQGRGHLNDGEYRRLA